MVEFLPEGYYRIERNRTIWEVPEKYNRLSSLSSKRSNGTEGYRQCGKLQFHFNRFLM